MLFYLIIFVPHVFGNLSHLITEPFGLQDFYVATLRQNLLAEIEGGTQTNCKDTVLIVTLNLPLRLMERQTA